MPATIFSFVRVVTDGPNGTTLYFRNSESEPRALALGELDGRHYVTVPEGVEMPEQQEEIDWQPVTLTDELRAELKAVSPHAKLARAQFIAAIRAKYTIDDELYFARIATGSVMGAYTLQAGEAELLEAYQAHVEEARMHMHLRYAELGLGE